METKVLELANGVYMISSFLENVGLSINIFLILDEKVTLIDAGSANTIDSMLEKIKEIIDPREIKYIMITHEHPDHLGGLPTLISEAYNAQVIAHKHIEVHLGFMGIFGKVITVNGGETFDLGQRKIKVFYTPIETLGTISFLLKPEGILFSGDYFGQILKEWSPFSYSSEDELISKIKEFHQGLGYSKEDIKKYLGVFLKEKVTVIATAHGSLITGNADKVMKKVIELELKPEGKGSILARLFSRK